MSKSIADLFTLNLKEDVNAPNETAKLYDQFIRRILTVSFSEARIHGLDSEATTTAISPSRGGRRGGRGASRGRDRASASSIRAIPSRSPRQEQRKPSSRNADDSELLRSLMGESLSTVLNHDEIEVLN